MLHSYSFSNFQSFRGSAEVSLLINNKAPSRGWEARSKGGKRLSTAIAMVGANGAGKTAALKPIVFAAWFISDSFSSPPGDLIPLTPHFAAINEPTEIEVIAEDDEGIAWRYVLKATKERVLHEALYRKNVGFKYVFLRDWDDEKREYQVKQQGFGLAPSEAKKVRPNASLISTALQYGIELAQHITSFLLVSNVNFMGRTHFQPAMVREVATHLSADEPLRQKLVALLTSWDLGLSDVQISQIDIPGEDGKTAKAWIPIGVHITREGNAAALLMEEESSGTQSAFVLENLIGQVLANFTKSSAPADSGSPKSDAPAAPQTKVTENAK